MAASPPRSWAPSTTFPCTEGRATTEALAAHLKIPRLLKTTKSSPQQGHHVDRATLCHTHQRGQSLISVLSSALHPNMWIPPSALTVPLLQS